MAGFYSDDFLDDLRARNDLVQVVSHYVPLKQKGRRFWGCCPFHNEKTPSFSVDPDKQMYYCFGCHAGGTVIHFIMNIEKCSFPEAVQHLAERAGIPLPESGDTAAYAKKKKQKERLYGALREAALFYHQALYNPGGEKALAYLKRRGMTDAEIKHFGLGYAPEGWKTISLYLQQKGYTRAELVQAGLTLVKGENYYDFFRDKVMFPIIDQQSRVLGFGGRLLSGEGPKYANTAETLVYNKREMLYGLNFYRRFGTARELFIVEGYMDLIALATRGVENVVASLGTALTTGQVRLIRRFADTVYFTYDGDSAGRNATLRGLDLAEEQGLNVRVVMLPDGLDPDDFMRQRGPDAFRELKANALTLTECKILSIKEQCDLSDENGRMAFARQAAALVKDASPVEQERYLRRIAEESGFAYETIRSEAAMPQRAEKKAPTRAEKQQHTQSEQQNVEQTLICMMLKDPQGAQKALRFLQDEDFTQPLARLLYQKLCMLGPADDWNMTGMVNAIDDPEQAGQAVTWMESEVCFSPQAVADLAVRLRVMYLNRQIDSLVQQTGSAPPEQKKQLAQQIQQTNQQIRALQREGIGHLRRTQ